MKEFFRRANHLLEQLEKRFPTNTRNIDWHYDAFRWRHHDQGRYLQAVKKPHRVALNDLLCMDQQKQEVVRNTEQFVRGNPANNVLLWGSRGTGKSTLVKAVFNHFIDHGLRLIEVEKEHLVDLPDIVEQLDERPEKFILFCDDLSFESDDSGYKSLKAALEGSIAAPPDNVLIYATSNRRHLLPELKTENQDVHLVQGEIHPGEAIEEKISLSERFGLWLSFYPFTQEQYLSIVDHWLVTGDTGDQQTRMAALRWARQHGSRSGRVARQFAIDHYGRQTP